MVSKGGKKPGRHLFIWFILAMSIAAPALAKDVFVMQAHGSYSFAAKEAFIEYCGVNGSINIETGASGYDDSFLLGAGGAFSGWQQEDAYALSRALALSGGGNVHALTHAYGNAPGVTGSGGSVTYPSGTTVEVTFTGSYANITESIDFGNLGVDPPGINVGIALDAESGWVRATYDGDDARIQGLAATFGISLTQAASLYNGGLIGLIGGLSQFGYSTNEVVNLALTNGLDHLRGLLAMLDAPYVAGPIDKAVAKYHIPWGQAKDLYREFGETIFCQALSTSDTYKTFVANLKGWGIAVWAGSLLDKTTVISGEVITAAFQLSHPITHEQFHDPYLMPYANVAQVLPDGKLRGLAGYFSYIEFSMDATTGTYYAQIRTAPDENDKLEPGEYCAFVVLRNPATDMYSKIRATFTVT